MIAYRIVSGIVVAFCRLFWRETIEGKENVPRDEPFVLAPVHRSNVDFALVAGVTKRRLCYMAKDTIFKPKPFAAFLRAMGAFPVHRGSADREAMRRVMEVIGRGEPVVIFPEGTRQSGPEVQTLFEGAAYVATRTGVPIVPVGIGGSELAMPRGSKFVKPVKVHVIIGPVLRPKPTEEGKRASRRAIHELTEQLHTELQKLFDQAQARV